MLMARKLDAELIDNDLLPFSYQDRFGWYAIYSNIRCEFRAKMGLEAKGYSVFLPTEKRWVRHARYKREEARPLFSRYLFVGVNPNIAQWAFIRETDGVEKLLANNGVPVRIPDDVVTVLRAAELEGKFDETSKIARLPVGSPVEILKGPLKGFVAELKSADSATKRAEILVNMLGQRCSARVEFARLRAV